MVVTENITLDGVIDAGEGWFNPGDADLSDVLDALEVQREAAGAFLAGRQTFEDMRGYWPHQTDDATGISDYLNAVSEYVVSTTLHDPQWEHSTVLRTLAEVAPGRDAAPPLRRHPAPLPHVTLHGCLPRHQPLQAR